MAKLKIIAADWIGWKRKKQTEKNKNKTKLIQQIVLISLEKK